MKSFTPLIFLVVFYHCLVGCQSELGQAEEAPVVEQKPTVDSLIETVLESGSAFEDISFASVVRSSAGHEILPIDQSDEIDKALVSLIGESLDETFKLFNKPDSPTNDERRINEVSSYFEDELRRLINADEAFSCDYPKTGAGKTQRSGYPDLRIVHNASGRVAYLDPKLVETTSLKSSLRTFYFTPKGETGKVQEDAHHLLIGIEHDGNDGAWQFLRWHLVDLSQFRVRLKAEFQASNKDLYIPTLIIGQGEK
ncbi:MAG: hypothetical protein AAF226_12155 [Verrucomicrobiota bacterium]